MSLGEKVKALRGKKGMNQKQVAEASSITQATISRIESGWVKELKSEALKRLAGALGVTVDYLVDKTEKLTPSDIISSDTTAQYILSVYEKLSRERRDQLKNFVRFLEAQEERPIRIQHRRTSAGFYRSKRVRRRRHIGRRLIRRRKEIRKAA
jgi:transcriptional regulator with XRE-family HTH domain